MTPGDGSQVGGMADGLHRRRGADEVKAAAQPTRIAYDDGSAMLKQLRPGAGHDLRPNAGHIAQGNQQSRQQTAIFYK